MTTAFKKLVLFGAIISFLTSVYVSFITVVVKKGIHADHLLLNWLKMIPRTYLLVLPYVLLTGPLVRKLVDRLIKD